MRALGKARRKLILLFSDEQSPLRGGRDFRFSLSAP